MFVKAVCTNILHLFVGTFMFTVALNTNRDMGAISMRPVKVVTLAHWTPTSLKMKTTLLFAVLVAAALAAPEARFQNTHAVYSALHMILIPFKKLPTAKFNDIEYIFFGIFLRLCNGTFCRNDSI